MGKKYAFGRLRTYGLTDGPVLPDVLFLRPFCILTDQGTLNYREVEAPLPTLNFLQEGTKTKFFEAK